MREDVGGCCEDIDVGWVDWRKLWRQEAVDRQGQNSLELIAWTVR